MLETKSELIDVITRLLWLLSVKHSTVNYPVSDYGAFTPVLPTKLYNDTSVPPGVFSELNLPNRNISLVSISSQSVIRLIDPFLLLQINGVTCRRCVLGICSISNSVISRTINLGEICQRVCQTVNTSSGQEVRELI